MPSSNREKKILRSVQQTPPSETAYCVSVNGRLLPGTCSTSKSLAKQTRDRIGAEIASLYKVEIKVLVGTGEDVR